MKKDTQPLKSNSALGGGTLRIGQSVITPKLTDRGLVVDITKQGRTTTLSGRAAQRFWDCLALLHEQTTLINQLKDTL